MHNIQIDWRDQVPVSRQFDDPYYSLENGVAETQHVFLAGNDLPHRFCDGFHVAELGFGTGVNLLVTLQAWRQAGITGRLRFSSFEAFPMAAPDMERAFAAFPTLSDTTDVQDILLTGAREITLPDLEFTLIIGDARTTLPQWGHRADAWFLDGFSPAKNPELWGAHLMQAVGQHTASQGTFATYTAAGHVRRALDHAGFAITRTLGYGRKRHMTRGALRPL